MHEMPEGWKRVRLSDTGAWLSGGTPSTDEPRFWDGDIPWISAASMKDFRITDSDRRLTRSGARAGTRLVSEQTVLFVVRGMSLKSEFRVGVTQRRVAFSQDCKAVIPHEGINATFLALAIKARTREILSMVDEAGHGTGRLPTDLISKLGVGVPPIEEQQRIVEIFDTLGSQVDHVGRLILKSTKIKTGLLRNFSQKYFSTADQFCLGELSEFITSGSRGWAEYYSDTGALFVRIGNLTREHINLRLVDKVFVRLSSDSEGRRTRLRMGDVLISITADLGIIGVVPDGLGEAYINQHVALVRLLPRVNSRWVGHMLASEYGQRQFRFGNDAGAKAGLNLPAISHISVPAPGGDIEDRATRALDEMDRRIHQLRDDREKLGLLKEGLMDDLLTGRVRVSEAEAVLERL